MQHYRTLQKSRVENMQSFESMCSVLQHSGPVSETLPAHLSAFEGGQCQAEGDQGAGCGLEESDRASGQWVVDT